MRTDMWHEGTRPSSGYDARMKRLALCSFAVLAVSTAYAQKVTTSVQKGGVKNKWKTSITMPRVSGGSALANYANGQFKASSAGFLASFKKQINETFKEGFDLPGPLELDAQPTFTLVSPNWITGYWTVYSFMGGAHGATGFVAFNYTMVGGKPKNAGLSDIFVNAKSASDDLTQLLTQKLLANPNALFIHDGTNKVAAEELPFTVTKTGLLFLIEPYIAGPYSEGTFKVPLAYKEIQAPFKLKGK